MECGNELRQTTGSAEFLSLAAISKVNQRRQRTSEAKLSEPTPRQAHVLLTLKRPEEVDLLRRVYGPGFFLIGAYASESERLEYLQTEYGMSLHNAEELVCLDQQDSHPFGQQTREAFHRADVFVDVAGNEYKAQLKRFLELIFKHPYHTPSPDEQAMFLAFAASLRSAQLGRQVGASITNDRGDILAIGCNEVPQPGGGTYWPGEGDQRDHIQGHDSNDHRKQMIAKDILSRLNLDSDKQSSAEIAIKGSLLFDITEFGRAVHAEMDAILSCARSGVSPASATLYTTTFPCHNCARHIVGAGLKRVVFIEPYPKSMASELHKDAICIEESDSSIRSHTVPFDAFVGIGPRRYADLFSVSLSGGFKINRKKDGNIIQWSESDASPRIPLQPISYLQREQVAADEVKKYYKGKI